MKQLKTMRELKPLLDALVYAERWEAVIPLAKEIFGPDLKEVTVALTSDYNDEWYQPSIFLYGYGESGQLKANQMLFAAKDRLAELFDYPLNEILHEEIDDEHKFFVDKKPVRPSIWVFEKE